MISRQEEWRQPSTGAWLEGVEERMLLETKALHTHKKEKMSGKPISRIQKKIEHKELPARLPDYFLRRIEKIIN